MKIIKELTDLTKNKWEKARDSSGTAGSYLKSYSYINGKKAYYKLSFFDNVDNIFGYESFNEIIAGKILEQLGYNHLDYNLVYAKIIIDNKEYNTYLNYSMDYKRMNESKISLETFYDLNKMDNESKLDFIKRYGFIEEIYQIIIIDYIIMNRDRHGANLEVLYNNKTKRYRLAPIFDNGLSLLSPAYKKEDILAFDIITEKRVNSYIGTSSLEENIKLVPNKYLKDIKIDLDKVFEDIKDILDNEYYKKVYTLLERRIEKIESICN